MIKTLFSMNALGTPAAFLAAFLIGGAFGWSLEQAGFGSSKRLSGIFYFRDMSVLKVMFSAVVTAMLGLGFLFGIGMLDTANLFLPETIWLSQIVGGIIFGIGFVIGGWCPGTAVVGFASGKIDALVFLIGSVLGSMLFNEVFPWIKSYYTAQNEGVRFIFEDIGVSYSQFSIAFVLVAILAFWISEMIEDGFVLAKLAPRATPLWIFSILLMISAVGLGMLASSPAREPMKFGLAGKISEPDLFQLLGKIQKAEDHIEPEDYARAVVARKLNIIAVDLRTAAEFEKYHIPGAANIQLGNLFPKINRYKDYDLIVLYSNGMTHAGQAWMALKLAGFKNVYILSDGLTGLFERCLKPAALRTEKLDERAVAEIGNWRAWFLGSGIAADLGTITGNINSQILDGGPIVDVDWLEKNLNKVVVIDSRSQPEYNSGHIPGSISLAAESFRGNVEGNPSMMLPPKMIAEKLSLAGIHNSDFIILVNDKLRDSTLIGMALELVGHKQYSILNGGFKAWVANNKPLDTSIPKRIKVDYQSVVPQLQNNLIIKTSELLSELLENRVKVLDVRPSDFFSGEKSNEARAGHIPGAINRPYTEDLMAVNESEIRPIEELKKEYDKLIPAEEKEIVVNCRTGHQASQAFFILKKLLGRKNVRLYDGSWTVWSSNSELPIEK